MEITKCRFIKSVLDPEHTELNIPCYYLSPTTLDHQGHAHRGEPGVDALYSPESPRNHSQILYSFSFPYHKRLFCGYVPSALAMHIEPS